MRKKILLATAIAIMFLIGVMLQAVTYKPITQYKREAGIVGFGAVVSDDSNDLSAIDTLEPEIGATLSIVSIYKHFGTASNRDLDLEELRRVGDRTLMVAWEPGGDDSTDYLTAIPAGTADTYIQSFADDIKTYGKPVIIRFGHEMNGDWYEWGGRASEYKIAYKYVVDYFRTANVTNVKWMWSINADNVPSTPISEASQYYPTESVVDYVGIDGYNTTTETFAQVFDDSYSFVSVYNRPVIISETGTVPSGKATWISGMFTTVEGYPLVTDIVWFNLNKESDWRIDTDGAEVIKEYMQEGTL